MSSGRTQAPSPPPPRSPVQPRRPRPDLVEAGDPPVPRSHSLRSSPSVGRSGAIGRGYSGSRGGSTLGRARRRGHQDVLAAVHRRDLLHRRCRLPAHPPTGRQGSEGHRCRTAVIRHRPAARVRRRPLGAPAVPPPRERAQSRPATRTAKRGAARPGMSPPATRAGGPEVNSGPAPPSPRARRSSATRSRNGSAGSASGPSTPAPDHAPVGHELQRQHRVDRRLPDHRLGSVLGHRPVVVDHVVQVDLARRSVGAGAPYPGPGAGEAVHQVTDPGRIGEAGGHHVTRARPPPRPRRPEPSSPDPGRGASEGRR